MAMGELSCKAKSYHELRGLYSCLKLHSTLQVAELLQGLFQELPNIRSKSIQKTISQATLALGTQHIHEVVEVILSLSQPSERYIFP